MIKVNRNFLVDHLVDVSKHKELQVDIFNTISKLSAKDLHDTESGVVNDKLLYNMYIKLLEIGDFG
jgi:hypothetical protein